MTKDSLARHGAFLFRWRSYLPLLLVVPGIMAMSDGAIAEEAYGDLLEELWYSAAIAISVLGLVVRWITVGHVPGSTSGRNTREQRAGVLNTTGMYSIVRNPLYLGNYLVVLGILASLNVWWFVLLGSLAYWIYIERIIAAEEEYLLARFGEQYARWAQRTPIFWPAFRCWRRPELPFSVRTVLRREYNGLLVVCAAFFLLDFATDVIFEGDAVAAWFREEPVFVEVLAVGAIVSLTLRTLKKRTGLLRVAGR